MNNESFFLKAKYIIIWDGTQHCQLEDGYLEVKGNDIAGFHKELRKEIPYEDLGDVAIVPGFINLHCHPSEVYGGRSYKEDCGNLNFYDSTLYDYAGLVSFGAESAEIQAKLNMAEILKSGCTTSLIFGGPESELEAEIADQMGARAYVGWGVRAGDAKEEISIWDSPDGHSLTFSFDETSGMERLKEAVDFAKNLENSRSRRIKGLLAPTQTMTCTEEMLRQVRKQADKHNIGITIHGSEDFIEFETSIRQRGKTPVEVMYETGLLGEDLIIAHCCCITEHSQIYMRGRDLQLLGQEGATVAHCPIVLAREGDTLETFERYQQTGVNMGIGTDTFPSDFIQEMRMAAIMGKVAGRSTFATSAKDVFYAATINGAHALGRKDLGKLTTGCKADFSVIRLDNIEMSPVRDVVKNIVYSATRHSIQHVYIDGERIVENGRLIGIDEKILSSQLQGLAEEAWEKASKKDRQCRGIDILSPLSCPKLKLNV
ncbi:5-methylthioadenosine/S-adenosylhomocysteine deaminase [Clostridiales Family XIII bacterium PM5-7]